VLLALAVGRVFGNRKRDEKETAPPGNSLLHVRPGGAKRGTTLTKE